MGSTDRLRRQPKELVAWLGSSLTFPEGVLLLTGTGIVPGGDFTLEAGDVIHISIDGVGTLTNTVKVV
jgi:2-dehydro-3-deoxy-D-arabinonate dehydratase